MTGTEELGRPFEFDVELLSEQHDVDLSNVLGCGMTIKVPLKTDSVRFFHGIVSRCQQGEFVAHRYQYRATLRPWLWFLTRTADCRIFQSMTTP
ncbi:MAG: contractile injection system protein, VgrG/Pvc8 family, partial [Planctomycetota bacterium]|nr:contractile injection system protein, VgrG/Pvc8 family [Planctomycetota bacterium]